MTKTIKVELHWDEATPSGAFHLRAGRGLDMGYIYQSLIDGKWQVISRGDFPLGLYGTKDVAVKRLESFAAKCLRYNKPQPRKE